MSEEAKQSAPEGGRLRKPVVFSDGVQVNLQTVDTQIPWQLNPRGEPSNRQLVATPFAFERPLETYTYLSNSPQTNTTHTHTHAHTRTHTLQTLAPGQRKGRASLLSISLTTRLNHRTGLPRSPVSRGLPSPEVRAGSLCLVLQEASAKRPRKKQSV